jgi:hypothetical protein
MSECGRPADTTAIVLARNHGLQWVVGSSDEKKLKGKEES